MHYIKELKFIPSPNGRYLIQETLINKKTEKKQKKQKKKTVQQPFQKTP